MCSEKYSSSNSLYSCSTIPDCHCFRGWGRRSTQHKTVTQWRKTENWLPVSERLRLRELPHPAQSENLDQAVRVQSSLHGTLHFLTCRGKGPAHRRHSVMFADSPLSPTQLIPAETQRNTTSQRSQLLGFWVKNVNVLEISLLASTSTCRQVLKLQCYVSRINPATIGCVHLV